MSLVNAYIGSMWKPSLIAWKSDCVILENKISSIPKPGTKATEVWNLKDFLGNYYAILHELWSSYSRTEPSHQMQTESS